MKCIVLKAVVMISYIMKSKIRLPKASSAWRSSSSPASYNSRWVEIAVEAAALRKWRRESFESFEHRGRSAPPLRCLLEEEWGNPERWLGGETPHITLGEAGSAVPGGEGQLAWQVRGKYWRQDVMGSEV